MANDKKSPSQIVDEALESILQASGSSLKNYTMQKSLDDMRKAMKKIMSDNYIQGSKDTFEVYRDRIES